MSTLTRTFARIGAALAALLFTGLGPSAFAGVPVPDPSPLYNGGSDRGHPAGDVPTTAVPPVQHHAESTTSGLSSITWLLIVAAMVVLTVLFMQALRRTRTARTATA
jgi:hypothetical protein